MANVLYHAVVGPERTADDDGIWTNQEKEKADLLLGIKGLPFKLFEENGDIHPSFSVQNRHLGEKGRVGEREREVEIKREIHP